jgi:NarL family two-component system response regulator LiaR
VAENGKQAVTLALKLNPDIVLMDLLMPVMNGLAAIAEIHAQKPEIKILVITSFDDDDKVFPAIKAGASGYLLKDTSPQQLVQSILDVYNGKSSLHPVIAGKILDELNKPQPRQTAEEKLTEREISVLNLIANGLSNLEIAAQLNLSVHSIRSYTSKILSKLHLANRTQITLYALREGLADLNGSASPQRKNRQ